MHMTTAQATHIAIHEFEHFWYWYVYEVQQ